MDWEKYKIWKNYLFNTQYKDNLINKAIGEFSRVVSDTNQSFQLKKDINKNDWLVYGKINNILDKINKKYKMNLGLPRAHCATVQKFKKMEDIIIGKMYNIPAISNGIDTTDKDYFFIPIHKTRRHVHGVPKEFLENYIINMIETAKWESRFSWVYSENRYIDRCAIYTCPEYYVEKKTKCKKEISVYIKIKEFQKYFTDSQFDNILKIFHKKRIDNFRKNFPSKIRYITYCTNNCINSIGFIHNGIPNGKQKCIIKYESGKNLSNSSIFKQTCNITYCRECGKSPYHDNELCKFVDDIQFENPELYRKCPGCEIWVEKKEGCDHMQCLCGVHFCYNCRSALNARDPYFHVCKMGNTDPHFRDFILDHPAANYPGEITCNCLNCK
jgi:hypothetical protein